MDKLSFESCKIIAREVHEATGYHTVACIDNEAKASSVNIFLESNREFVLDHNGFIYDNSEELSLKIGIIPLFYYDSEDEVVKDAVKGLIKIISNYKKLKGN